MASDGSRSDLPLRIVLTLAVIGLAVALLYVTVVPAQKAAEMQAVRASTHQRMSDVRTALTAFREVNEEYPSTLDSLVLFARTDSTFQARIASEDARVNPVSVDSMILAPTSGRPFQYAANRDTSGVDSYWLGNPDTPSDSIGARGPDGPRYRNAASWE